MITDLCLRQALRKVDQIGYITPEGGIVAYDRVSKVEKTIQKEDIVGMIFSSLQGYESARALQSTRDEFGVLYEHNGYYVSLRLEFDVTGSWFVGSCVSELKAGPTYAICDFQPRSVIDADGKAQSYRVQIRELSDLVAVFEKVLKVPVDRENINAALMFLEKHPTGMFKQLLEDKIQNFDSEY